QERRELSVASLARGKLELVDNRERQLDDVAAVNAGVSVVSLDDVAEQESGPSVRVSELELVVDANAALAREHGEERDQRERQENAPRRRLRREGDGEADRSQARVDRVDGRHRAQLHGRPDAERNPLAAGGR